MDLLVVLLVLVLFFGVPAGWHFQGPYFGGGIGLIVIIILIVLIARRI